MLLVSASFILWRAPVIEAGAIVHSKDLSPGELVARGEYLVTAGNCASCHTTQDGAFMSGGLPFRTPFGTIYATNITPDVETGIGAWSYPAFERAMRDGLHRDGRQLYPAFPYTHFAKTSDADMQALYAYLMAQPAVRATTPVRPTL